MRTLFVLFVSAESGAGKKYNDGRSKYDRKSGLLVISDGQMPNTQKAAFHMLDENGHVSTLATSSGQIVENDECLSIKTSHSIYVFGKKYNLTEEEKQKLLDHVDRY